MAKHKLIVELTEARYRDLCRVAEECLLLPADAAEVLLSFFLVTFMIRLGEAEGCDF